jgi:large subunit ribosomal protein L18
MSPRATGRLQRQARHKRVRTKVRGTAERPRLSVFRSLNHIYAQVIDDDHGVTLAAASSLEGEVKGKKTDGPKRDVSTHVGDLLARRAKKKGVKSVVFDRGGFKYHGRV